MEVESSIENKELAKTLTYVAFRPRRLILNHLRKADYSNHTAVVLNMKPSITRRYFHDLTEKELIFPIVKNKKKANFDPSKRGGCHGQGLSLYVTSEKGLKILECLTAPAPLPPPIKREEKKPFTEF